MKKNFVHFLLFVFAMTVVFLSLQYPVIQAATSTSLNGTDIYNGLRGQNFDEGWNFYKGDVGGGQNTTFNDSNWANITLPHDWSIYNAFNQGSAGVIWTAALAGTGKLSPYLRIIMARKYSLNLTGLT
jgi:beta-galactosidase